jgi:hypothetical protein
MLSHDLAHALLARRNNDVRIEVLVDDDPAGERDIWAKRIELRDDLRDGSTFRITADELVTYDTDDDFVVIRAGYVIVGGPPDE